METEFLSAGAVLLLISVFFGCRSTDITNMIFMLPTIRLLSAQNMKLGCEPLGQHLAHIFKNTQHL